MAYKIVFGKGFSKDQKALSDDDQYHLEKLINEIKFDRLSPGVNREVIKCKSGEHVFSFRVNRDVRLAAYLWKPKEYLLLACDHHDNLYKRIERCPLSKQKAAELPILNEVDYQINENPIPLQVNETRPVSDHEGTSSQTSKFENKLTSIPSTEFLKLDLSSSAISTLKDAKTEDDIIEAISTIESPTLREGLLSVALGEKPIDAVIKTFTTHIDEPRRDVTTILEKNIVDRENYFILNDEIIELYTNGKLENWQVYLHPDQTRGVEMEARGPMMITGPAGTGKSIVAIHRAKWLLRNPLKNNGKILFTTYTHTLAEYAKNLLETICTPEEMARIEVVHFDAFLQRLLRRKLPHVKIYYASKNKKINPYSTLLKKIYEEYYHGPQKLRFVEMEYDRVIAEYNIKTQEEYLSVIRPKDLGRLNSDARIQLWPIFETLNSYKECITLCPRPLAINMLTDCISSTDCIFKSIIVDEAQDFGASEYRLFAKLTGNTYQNSIAYSLFFAGDGHQRIYKRSGSLKQCGINVTGRSIHLTKCYRSTKKIREYAEKIIANVQVKDMDEEIDHLNGCESLTEGVAPEIKLGFNENSKYEIMASKLKQWIKKGCQLGDCAILVRKNTTVENIVTGLSNLNINAIKIDRENVNFGSDSIKVMTMHRAKGLQFINVIVDLDGWPQEGANEIDEEAYKQLLATEKCILYMSIMRAMNDVLITNSYGSNRHIPMP